MPLNYIELESKLPLPRLEISHETADLALDLWGDELLYVEAMNVKGSIQHGNLEGFIAGEAALADNAYAIATGKYAGGFNYMRFSVDATAETVSLEVLRVTAESNPYRQPTVELALDAVDAITATPCGVDALKFMHCALELEPAVGLITAPAAVVAELEAYAAAHGVSVLKCT